MFHRTPPTSADKDSEQIQDAPISAGAPIEEHAGTPNRTYVAPYVGSYTRNKQQQAQQQQQQQQQQAAPSRKAQAADEQSRRLVIGQGITLSGEVGDCDHIVIEGTVEAALRGTRVLEITETGTFYGSVEVVEATVAGRFEGDLVVEGLLRVTATGSIVGALSCKTLEVEAGAHIDGRISPLGRERSASTQNSAAKPQAQQSRKAPAAPTRGGGEQQIPSRSAIAQTPANIPVQASENQLFAANVAVGA